jgi:hypothetical protein
MRELYKSVLEERSSNWNSLKEEAASRYTNKVNRKILLLKRERDF